MMSPRFRPPVSPLFVPGDRPERFAKAAASGADAVILDLEDAVAPAAREMAREAVANHGVDSVTVIVRINAASREEFQADLAALRDARFDALMLANCPFHALAQRQTELVCGMNLRLLEGVVEGVDDGALTARLCPTAGACCVRLEPTGRAG